MPVRESLNLPWAFSKVLVTHRPSRLFHMRPASLLPCIAHASSYPSVLHARAGQDRPRRARRASVVWPPAVNALRPDPHHHQRRKSSCMEACGPAISPVATRPCVSLLSKRSPASLLAEQAAGHRARASLQPTQLDAVSGAGHHRSWASLRQAQWDATLSTAAAGSCRAGSEAGEGPSRVLPPPPAPRLRRSGGRMLRVLRSAHHPSTASSEGGSSLRWTDWSSFGSGATGVSEKRPCASPGAPPLVVAAEEENSDRIARLFASAFLPTRGRKHDCLF